MLNLGSFFKKGAAEATATELGEALRAAEADRQRLREREQVLSVSRQDVLLEGSDEDLDAIEAELATIARAAERHDLRIPELRRVHGERQAREETEANRQAFERAVTERLAVAEQIDTTLVELGRLFSSLEQQAVILRNLDGYHHASRKGNGPMSLINLDAYMLREALLVHVPSVARALDFGDHVGGRPIGYHASEARFWNTIARGPEPVTPGPQVRQTTADDAEQAAIARHQASRFRETELLLGS